MTSATIRRRSTRRSRSPTTRASARARRPRPPRASCAASASRPISRRAAWRRRRRPAAHGRGVGFWESAEVRVNMVGTVEVLTGCHSHGQGHETTYAQLVCSRLGIPIENVSDRPRRHRQGADGHGHLWIALGRGRHVGNFEGARQDRGQGQEGRRPRSRGFRSGHRVQRREVHGQGHGQVDRLRLGRAERLYRAQVQRPGAGAGSEGRLRSGTRRTSPSRPAFTSANSRSIRRPASSRSTAGPRSTTSASSSIR